MEHTFGDGEIGLDKVDEISEGNNEKNDDNEAIEKVMQS